MEVHLDLVGGMAGDMFIAALLDAFPQHEACVLGAIGAVGGTREVVCSLVPHRDEVLRGRQFRVRLKMPDSRETLDGHDRDRGIAAAIHEHIPWTTIRGRLLEARLAPGVRGHALKIFEILADAEAFVHGIPPDQVTFHEVGAWDSIADVVGAAALIEALGAVGWTASPAPLGAGRIRTAHGVLAAPAPATAHLLLGMPTIDDGVPGERVTPTGAAILRYLCPAPRAARRPDAAIRTLAASGTGFGMRVLPGMSNHLRVLCFDALPDDDAQLANAEHRSIDVLEFEVDDQSGEDLATGLERLRERQGVLDVTQTPVFGKKGRMMVHVRVLVSHLFLADAIEACFVETTTIGLRHRTVRGIGLARRPCEVSLEGRKLRVKVVDRPGGKTAKTEADDVSVYPMHAQRAAMRARAEAAALQPDRIESDG